MRKILVFLLFLLFLFSPKYTFAQEPPAGTPAPTAPPLSPCYTGSLSADDEALTQDLQADDSVTTNPPSLAIDETLPCVDVTFHGVSPNTAYFLCTGDSDCYGTTKISDDAVLLDSIQQSDSSNPDDVTVTFRVCGDGQSKIKVKNCTPDNSKNWFWGGNLYYFSIVAKISNKNNYIPIKTAGFYVSKSYPTVTISPNQNLTTNTGSIHVDITGGTRPGGKNRNNYQIKIDGAEGYSKSQCVVSDAGGKDFSGIDKVGIYTILVNDQINEQTTSKVVNQLGKAALGGGAIGAGVGGNPASAGVGAALGAGLKAKDILSSSGCEGGFTFYKITCTVTAAGAKGTAGSCTDPGQGKDPTGAEYRAFIKDLAALNKAGGSISFPCGDGKGKGNMVTDPGACKSIDTAIGPIAITPEGFITSIFKLVLTLAAFGGVIIIIYSGYMLMTSSSDKEKIAGARETITAAIVGLLFIVLAIVILEIIGVDILHIPGFGR